MGFRQGGYIKIWSYDNKGNYGTINMSVSKKNQSGAYQTTFAGFANVVGTANTYASSLGLPTFAESKQQAQKKPVSAQILSCDVTDYYDKAKIERLLAAAGNNEELRKFISANARVKSCSIFELGSPDGDGSTPSAAQAAPTAAAASQSSVIIDDPSEDDLPF